jgi:Family of unknown function (DUF5309)
MGTVSGQGTTYALPNYSGDLYLISPTETPFLSAIGGISGGKTTKSTEFEWETETIEDTSAGNTALEGANAPTGSESARSNVSNVVEIHHEAIEVTYTKMAATGLKSGINNEEVNPVTNELDHQISLKLRKIAVDVEKSFLSGVYQKPSNNSTPRKTRGILSAISSNLVSGSPSLGSATIVDTTGVFTSSTHGLSIGDVVYLGAITTTTGLVAGKRYYAKTVPSGTTFTLSATLGGVALTLGGGAGSTTDVIKAGSINKASVDRMLQTAFDNGAILPQNETVFMVGSGQKIALSNLYSTAVLNQPTMTRNVGGVAVDTIVTDFGVFGVMLDRWMPAGQVGVVDLSVCAPVHLDVPGKSPLFVEQLALVGSAQKWQAYGEIGLEYGPENNHALLTALL